MLPIPPASVCMWLRPPPPPPRTNTPHSHSHTHTHSTPPPPHPTLPYPTPNPHCPNPVHPAERVSPRREAGEHAAGRQAGAAAQALRFRVGRCCTNKCGFGWARRAASLPARLRLDWAGSWPHDWQCQRLFMVPAAVVATLLRHTCLCSLAHHLFSYLVPSVLFSQRVGLI